MKKVILTLAFILSSTTAFATQRYTAYVAYSTEENLNLNGDTFTFTSLISENNTKITLVDSVTGKTVLEEYPRANPFVFNIKMDSKSSITLSSVSGGYSVSGPAAITKKLFTTYGVVGTLQNSKFPTDGLNLVKDTAKKLIGNEDFSVKALGPDDSIDVACGVASGKNNFRCAIGTMRMYLIEDSVENPAPVPNPEPVPNPTPIPNDEVRTFAAAAVFVNQSTMDIAGDLINPSSAIKSPTLQFELYTDESMSKIMSLEKIASNISFSIKIVSDSQILINDSYGASILADAAIIKNRKEIQTIAANFNLRQNQNKFDLFNDYFSKKFPDLKTELSISDKPAMGIVSCNKNSPKKLNCTIINGYFYKVKVHK